MSGASFANFFKEQKATGKKRKSSKGPSNSSKRDVGENDIFVNTKKRRKREVGSSVPRNESKLATKNKSGQKASDSALALSSQLKDLSMKKRLKEALDLYWSKKNDDIRDHYHGSIVVDCCSRCGAVAEGERVIEYMRKAGDHIPIQANTSLMKGYCHATNKMDKAFDLFCEMFRSKNKRDHPNVRTLNTFLRGCLWSATVATSTSTENNSAAYSGGSLASETVWNLCKIKNMNKLESNKLNFDISSYEYSITILCNALLIEEAKNRVEEMKEDIHIGADDQESFNEVLASSHVLLSRANALLGNKDAAIACANDALEYISKAGDCTSNFSNITSNKAKSSGKTSGGRRAWGSKNERRMDSNVKFRGHKLSELRNEAKSLIKYSTTCSMSAKESCLLLSRLLETRLLYFSGGGTTQQLRNEEEMELSMRELNSLFSSWYSFGLCAAKGKKFKWPTTTHCVSDKSNRIIPSIEWAPEVRKLAKKRKIFNQDGTIDFSAVFTMSRMPCIARRDDSVYRPLFLELGAGSGEWIVNQARANPDGDYVSVELRSDRVAQTFAKAFLNKIDKSKSKTAKSCALTNLCCIGAECGHVLKKIRGDSIQTIFVNHPEPPIQVDDDVTMKEEEMGHMLNSDTLINAVKCLKKGGTGRLVIVTDNNWYARLICMTILKVMEKEKYVVSSELIPDKRLRLLETFKGTARDTKVHLYVGTPTESIGYLRPEKDDKMSGSSYFDKLWRTGAGSHSEQFDRFIVVCSTAKL